jgi:hypothetical protein
MGGSAFNWLADITGDEWDRARREEVDLVPRARTERRASAT